jgi:hypothetical protein
MRILNSRNNVLLMAIQNEECDVVKDVSSDD